MKAIVWLWVAAVFALISYLIFMGAFEGWKVA